MCFWLSKYSERGLRFRSRHWSHRKHLNQDCDRAITQQFKNRPYKELDQFIKKVSYIESSNVSFGSQWWGIGWIVGNESLTLPGWHTTIYSPIRASVVLTTVILGISIFVYLIFLGTIKFFTSMWK